MKHLYSCVLLCTALIAFSSCAKLNPESKIVGTWKLDDVVKRRFLSNSHVGSDYTVGLFRFYDNGTATYTDTVTLNGYWSMHYQYGYFYDDYGNYSQRNYLVLRINLANFTANRFIDWVFDEASFKRSSDRLDGFMYYATSSYQYSFRRQ
ncbi:MAG: hypothetical protein JST86_18975 [Bacteroidetes bacterium]|nr:hypothetical protein [Bacteroidota bacterium]